MPTVVSDGPFRFVINTRENLFEPPHASCLVGNEDVCRIELNSGDFMEEPPSGTRRDIIAAYRKHAAAIREVWDRVHGR